MPENAKVATISHDTLSRTDDNASDIKLTRLTADVKK